MAFCKQAGINCHAPSGYLTSLGTFFVKGKGRAHAKCFRCGGHVCSDFFCSRIIKYYNYGRKRLCIDCIEEYIEDSKEAK